MVVLLLDLFLFSGGGGFLVGESLNMSAIPGESGSMPMAIVISARLIEGVCNEKRNFTETTVNKWH